MPKDEKVNIYVMNGYVTITKEQESDFFSSHKNYFSIPLFNLAVLLKFLLARGLMSPKILEGVLSEYYEESKWKV